VISRRVFVVLVGVLAVLLVTFSVVMAFYALLKGLDDATGAQALLWTGIIFLMLIVVDTLLLVGALGVKALEDREEEPRD
jgi:uncharacterized membrane protein YhaH (DUF805 family)